MRHIIEYNYTGMQLKLLDSLTKVFSDEEPKEISGNAVFQAFSGECTSFQIGYSCCGYIKSKYSANRPNFRFARVRVDSPIREYVKVRRVCNVPCQYPSHTGTDDNYLRKVPGLYPDRLEELQENMVTFLPFQWQSLWIDAEIPCDALPGTYPVRIVFEDEELEDEIVEMCAIQTEVTILPAQLPKQTFPRTEWFYADCLADFYHVPVFSEEHWKIMENYVKAAARRGITMLLTPQFTPPLDTAVGKERTTVQLVDVVREGDGYHFGFEKLERWIALCRKHGILYFEMSHLFSQWGAVAAPKIVELVDGKEQILFDFHTPATGGEYTRFLHIYLPQLLEKLKEIGVLENTFFHISDEPNLEQLSSYRAAYESVAEELKGCKRLEALSNFEFYQNGLVERPICGTHRIKTFLEAEVPELWSYYCTVQSNILSNRFIAMPSGRTRIYGVQIYKFGIKGSLHWGYNFYNSVDSLYKINPFLVTDAGGAYPAGDPFIVYPKEDGTPEESIRMMLLDEAMSDLRALCYLEELTSREHVLALIDEDLDRPLDFDAFPTYPKDADYLFGLRKKVNAEICKAIKK